MSIGKTPIERPLRRLLNIVVGLLERPMTRDEVAVLAGSDRDPSSVSRDISVLRSMGWEVDSGPRRPYSIKTGRIPLLVSVEEAKAIRRAWDITRHAGFPEAVTLTHLLGRIPESIRKAAFSNETEMRVTPAVSDYRASAETLETIRGCLATGRRLRIRYQVPWSAQASSLLVDAAELAWIEGALILFGYCPNAKGKRPGDRTREFRIERIRGVEPLKEVCTLSAVPAFEFTYRLSANLIDSFTPSAQHRIIERHPDGALVVEGRLTSKLRARRYLLAFGLDAEALGPDSLRAEMVASLGGALALYT